MDRVSPSAPPISTGRMARPNADECWSPIDTAFSKKAVTNLHAAARWFATKGGWVRSTANLAGRSQPSVRREGYMIILARNDECDRHQTTSKRPVERTGWVQYAGLVERSHALDSSLGLGLASSRYRLSCRQFDLSDFDRLSSLADEIAWPHVDRNGRLERCRTLGSQ
jgi:hypothetical protein